MMVEFAGFQAIAQGDSHKEKELPCQDAVFYQKYINGGIIAVADGHGSEKHFRSQYGSEIAVKVAQEAISQFCTLLSREFKKTAKEKRRYIIRGERAEEQIKQLERYIISQWRQQVLQHFSENPLDEPERMICVEHNLNVEEENDRVRLYGTTLISGCVQERFWLAVQIGDGKCVMLDEQGKPSFPVPEDESLGGGKTTSLCDSKAIENFRHAFGFELIKGLTVATDGVSDSFIPEDYLSFHERLYTDISNDEESAQDNIQKALPQWSIKGSRDDVSMAGIFICPSNMVRSILKSLKKTK